MNCATVDQGYRAVENPLEIHDLHATMLYVMGTNYTKPARCFGGGYIRLTDVHGRVIR